MTIQSNRDKKTGIWLIGAFGGVGTTIAVGLASLRQSLVGTTGLSTALPNFEGLPFACFDNFVIGGHDVRKSSFAQSADELFRKSRVFSPGLLTACNADLATWSENVRPGVVRRSGRPVEAFADWQASTGDEPPLATSERIGKDIMDFAERNRLEHVIVVNVSSSEPMAALGPEHRGWKELESRLKKRGEEPLPASSLYALAAIERGLTFINFTPSLGIDVPALEERALERDVLFMGRDGKTGETLMKAVLAPMFLKRNLQVMSWVGHNILGNRDGQVLQDPINKQGKIDSKGHLISQILGYEPQTLVTIEHIESLGDWKTAWDHIHFEGFLGTKMSLQFIWQGCDSLLAAPLAIDLVRWAELARRRRETGCMTHLAAYFKTPMRTDEQDFFRQWQALETYAASCRMNQAVEDRAPALR